MTLDLIPDGWLLDEYRQHLALSAPASAKDAEWACIAAVPVNSLHIIYIFVATTPTGVHIGQIHANYDELDVYVSNALPLPTLPAPSFIVPERIKTAL